VGRCVYVVFAASLFLHLILFWPTVFRPAEPTVTPLVVRFVQTPVVGSETAVAQRSEGEALPRRTVVPNGAGMEAPRGMSSRDVAGLNQVASRKRHPNDGVKADGPDVSPADSAVLSQSIGSIAEDGAAYELRIRRYRFALASAAIRLQQASSTLPVGGHKGRSVVIVHVMPGVAFPDVRIAESSGAHALDERALLLVRHALSEVPVPVQDRQFSIVLPVLFEEM